MRCDALIKDPSIEMVNGAPARANLRGTILAVMMAGLLSGCSEELGPVPLDVTAARGIVREGRKPVSGGWIEFFPVDGTIGNLRSARIGADGAFRIDGVAVGKNLVRLVNVRLGSPQVEQLFGSMQSPMRRVVVRDSTTPIDIDVVEEVYGMDQSRRRQPARPVQKAGKPQ